MATHPGTGRTSDDVGADWQRRVVGRSLKAATERSVDRGLSLIRAAAVVLERGGGDDITVQEVADEAGQSLRTLYQYFESKDDLLLAVFEESMRGYAGILRAAISDLEDPLERLGGALIASVRMAEAASPGMSRGLARLRLQLSEADADMVAAAQQELSWLVGRLITDATGSGQLSTMDVDGATFAVLSLNAAFITSATLGNDVGVGRPEVVDFVSLTLRGLGAEVDEAWVERVESGLRFGERGGARTAR